MDAALDRLDEFVLLRSEFVAERRARGNLDYDAFLEWLEARREDVLLGRLAVNAELEHAVRALFRAAVVVRRTDLAETRAVSRLH